MTISTLPQAGTVSTEHPLYKRFTQEYRTIEDCIAGQSVIKRAGVLYLPKPEAWTMKRYNAYKRRAHFLNATYRTQMGMVGIAFAKPATYTLPAGVEYLSTDIDGEGLDMDQLVRMCVSQNITFGRGGLLVDYDAPEDSGQVTTLANSGRATVRMFDHRQIINWRKSKGKYTLIVLRYLDDVDYDGFEHYQVVRYLELRLIDGRAYSRLWTDELQGAGGLPASVMQGQGGDMNREEPQLRPIKARGKHLDYLPFCWFGSERNDSEIDPAPLSDIANTNIAHYNADADNTDSSFICGQPTFVIAGVPQNFKKDNPNIKVGGDEAIILQSMGTGTPNASMVVAPPNTPAAALLEKREKQLAMLGAKLVERNGATKTATQAGADEKTDNSILSQCVGNVEAAFNQAMEFIAAFTGATGGNVHINKRYEDVVLNPSELTSYMAAVQSGMMRMIDFLAWQQRIGLIPNDADLEDVEQELRDSAEDTQLIFNAAARQAQQGLDNPDDQQDEDEDPERDQPISKKKASAPRKKRTNKETD